MSLVTTEEIQVIYDYLSLRDDLGPADLIIGFGHFDLRIPTHCVHLYQCQVAPKILFTGGVGAGSADLIEPEGSVFQKVAMESGVPEVDLFVEIRSTNTSENIAFSRQLLSQQNPPFAFRSALLVAHPYRQRRVFLTIQKHLPGLKLFNAPPDSSLQDDIELFHQKGQDLAPLLLGEVDRINKYGKLGWIQETTLPAQVESIYKRYHRA